MYTKFLTSTKFHSKLFKYDQDLASECWAKPCTHCDDKLNQAHYQRKPRCGVAIPEEEAIRFSYCCRGKGCRKRKTPLSLRFLGPKVYLSIVVTLFSALSQGVSDKRFAKLNGHIGVSRQTLKRWRSWWRDDVPGTSFWKEARGRFQLPVPAKKLPESLTQYFQSFESDSEQSLVSLLQFIGPLGTLRK